MEMHRIGGFLDEGQRAECQHAAHGLILDIRGDDDGLALELFFAQLRKHLIAVQLWHREVEQHHVDATLADPLQRFQASRRLTDGYRPAGRQRLQQLLAREG